jgi:hypothetical protein
MAELDRDRETIRGRLAQVLIWALVALSVGTLVLLGLGRITVQELPSVTAIAAPLVGIAGAAIGFYFRGDARLRKRGHLPPVASVRPVRHGRHP